MRINNILREEKRLDAAKEVLLLAIKSMTAQQLDVFIDKHNIDMRRWYRVRIDGELVPWWALEYELDRIKNKEFADCDVSFSEVLYSESLSSE